MEGPEQKDKKEVAKLRIDAIRKLADQEYVRTGGSATRYLSLLLAVPASGFAWRFASAKGRGMKGLFSFLVFFTVLAPSSHLIGKYRGDKQHSVAFTEEEIELMRGTVSAKLLDGLRRE